MDNVCPAGKGCKQQGLSVYPAAAAWPDVHIAVPLKQHPPSMPLVADCVLGTVANCTHSSSQSIGVHIVEAAYGSDLCYKETAVVPRNSVWPVQVAQNWHHGDVAGAGRINKRTHLRQHNWIEF